MGLLDKLKSKGSKSGNTSNYAAPSGKVPSFHVHALRDLTKDYPGPPPGQQRQQQYAPQQQGYGQPQQQQGFAPPAGPPPGAVPAGMENQLAALRRFDTVCRWRRV